MANEYTLSHTATEIDEILGSSVLCTEQSLTDEQKAQARENIGITEQVEWGTANETVVSGYIKWDGSLVSNSSYRTAYAAINPDCKYRVTACLNTGIDILVMFFDESGKRIEANIHVGPFSGGVKIPTSDGINWYDYDQVEIAVPSNACSMTLSSGNKYRQPLIEKSVTLSGLVGEVEQLTTRVDNIASLAGKTIVNFGDSIFGKRRPPNDISTELARLTGATVHNCGFGGCRMAKHTMTNFDAFSMYRLADAIVSGDWSLQDAGIADTTQAEAVPSYFTEALAILKGLDFADVDIITIAYGTNDFTGWVSLDDEDDAKNTNAFAGALRYSIETLLNAYPHLKIFVCSQTYRFWMDASNVFTEDSDTYERSGGVKLTDFVAKTEEVAKAYHLPYVNNYDIGMNKYNKSHYFSATDGTHPLTTGCHLIAAHIAKKLF